MWRRPFFRFRRAAAQHNVLRRLERNLLGQAVVRYAAPAFHELGELEEAQIRRRVIELSGHVSPVTLGSHRVWTYIGPGTHGRGNPDSKERPFEPFESLFVPTPWIKSRVTS